MHELGALAGGETSYAMFLRQAKEWYGMVILIGISWAFFNHMASGIRHFVLDIGAGYELKNNAAWSVFTPLAALAATVLAWAAILLR